MKTPYGMKYNGKAGKIVGTNKEYQDLVTGNREWIFT